MYPYCASGVYSAVPGSMSLTPRTLARGIIAILIENERVVQNDSDEDEAKMVCRDTPDQELRVVMSAL